MIEDGFGMHGLTADQYFAEVGQCMRCGNPACFELNKSSKKSFVDVPTCMGSRYG